MRARRYSRRTEQAYIDWVRRFILFHGKRHPRELGAFEVELYLTVGEKVSTNTQKQALMSASIANPPNTNKPKLLDRVRKEKTPNAAFVEG